MKNTRNRYKPSPLQIWRAQYAYISHQIRMAKTAGNVAQRLTSARIGEMTFPSEWSPASVKRVKRRLFRPAAINQREVLMLREHARTMMAKRSFAALAAKKLWEAGRN